MKRFIDLRFSASAAIRLSVGAFLLLGLFGISRARNVDKHVLYMVYATRGRFIPLVPVTRLSNECASPATALTTLAKYY